MTAPRHEQNIFAFWRQGEAPSSEAPPSKTKAENQQLYSAGTLGVFSLIEGIHYAYGYSATITNTIDDTLRPELVQLYAELQKRSIAVSWVLFPPDAPGETLEPIPNLLKPFQQ